MEGPPTPCPDDAVDDRMKDMNKGITVGLFAWSKLQERLASGILSSPQFRSSFRYDCRFAKRMANASWTRAFVSKLR